MMASTKISDASSSISSILESACSTWSQDYCVLIMRKGGFLFLFFCEQGRDFGVHGVL
jgi:hypothetical protein